MEFHCLKRISWIPNKLASCGVMLSFFSSMTLANTLVDVKYHSLVKQQLAVELIFSEAVTSPNIDLIATPAALSLTFADSKSELSTTHLPIDKSGVSAIDLAAKGSELVINLNMDKIRPYQEEIHENIYRLTLNDVNNIQKKQSANRLNKIDNIDFRLGTENAGRLIVQLHTDTVAVDVEQIGAKLELQFFNTDIPDSLLYVMDVQDFATPVKNFETFRDQTTTKILLDINGDYEYEYQQQDNLLLLDVKAVKSHQEKAKKDYSGKSLSMNFQSIPVRTVLQIIADYNKFNLVTSDTVNGDITLRLDDVPWDQALDLILQTKGLDKRIEGNILMVAPADEIASRESQNLKNQQQVKELAPLYSEYLQINYAKAEDIAALLKSTDSSLLSSRGSVAVDERTNTLLVKDTAESLSNISRLVKVLDIPIRQVLIESRMVTVKDDVAEDIGVRWGITEKNSDYGTSGSLEGAQGSAGGSLPDINDRLNVNFPAAVSNPASIAFHVAKLSGDTVLDLELSALEQENKGEIIASPRITTSNQKAAYIEQGVEIPYVESSSSGATSVTFKKAVLSLRVIPQITPDNRVVLDLEITQDSQGKTVDTATGPAVAIDTQRIGTQVLVDNGETIVLGGIYQQNTISRVSKVPLLGDLPLLGFLFRNSTEQNERQELLIFVTPKIVTEAI